LFEFGQARFESCETLRGDVVRGESGEIGGSSFERKRGQGEVDSELTIKAGKEEVGADIRE